MEEETRAVRDTAAALVVAPPVEVGAPVAYLMEAPEAATAAAAMAASWVAVATVAAVMVVVALVMAG